MNIKRGDLRFQYTTDSFKGRLQSAFYESVEILLQFPNVHHVHSITIKSGDMTDGAARQSGLAPLSPSSSITS